jgi:hypothetical protein
MIRPALARESGRILLPTGTIDIVDAVADHTSPV